MSDIYGLAICVMMTATGHDFEVCQTQYIYESHEKCVSVAQGDEGKEFFILKDAQKLKCLTLPFIKADKRRIRQ